MTKRIPIEQRLIDKLDKGSGPYSCWIFTASKNWKGYGKIGLGGDNGWALAHRVAYSLWVGPLDDKKVVMHTCDTPACCNPSHLKLATQAENLIDMRNKGRGCFGDKMRNSLLSSDKFLSRPKRNQAKDRVSGRFTKEI